MRICPTIAALFPVAVAAGVVPCAHAAGDAIAITPVAVRLTSVATRQIRPIVFTGAAAAVVPIFTASSPFGAKK
jgi:hypothetical protein